MQYNVKLDSERFKNIKNGVKKFEVLKDDKNYKVSDILILEEEGSNEKMTMKVTYKSKENLEDGYCILGIEPATVGNSTYIVARAIKGLNDFYYEEPNIDLRGAKVEMFFNKDSYEVYCRIKIVGTNGSERVIVLKQEV